MWKVIVELHLHCSTVSELDVCGLQGAASATMMVQSFHKAGVPKGVINVATGELATVRGFIKLSDLPDACLA